MKIEAMDRRTVRAMIAELKAVVEGSERLKALGLTLEVGGGSYSDHTLTAKVKFSLPVKAIVGGVDAQSLALGLARPGTQAMRRGRTVTILEAKRSKYLFEFNDQPGEKWLCAFTAFQPCKAQAEAVTA